MTEILRNYSHNYTDTYIQILLIFPIDTMDRYK